MHVSLEQRSHPTIYFADPFTKSLPWRLKVSRYFAWASKTNSSVTPTERSDTPTTWLGEWSAVDTRSLLISNVAPPDPEPESSSDRSLQSRATFSISSSSFIGAVPETGRLSWDPTLVPPACNAS